MGVADTHIQNTHATRRTHNTHPHKHPRKHTHTLCSAAGSEGGSDEEEVSEDDDDVLTEAERRAKALDKFK